MRRIHLVFNETGWPLFVRFFLICASMILVLLLVMSLVINFSVINQAEKEIGEAAINSLKLISDMDKIIANNVREIALMLASDGNLNALYRGITSSYDKITPPEHQNILKIRSQLVNVILGNELISSIYIYLKDPSLLITSNDRVFNFDDYFDLNWWHSYEKNTQPGVIAVWLDTRKAYDEDYSLRFPGEYAFSYPSDYVMTYVFPLAINTTPIEGHIVINVSERQYSRLMNARSESNVLWEVDENGIILSHPNQALIGVDTSQSAAFSQAISLSAQWGWFIESTQEGRMMYAYSHKTNGHFLIYEHSLAGLSSRTMTPRLLMIGALVGTGLSALAAIFVAFKKQLIPVRRLVGKIQPYSDNVPKEWRNEFSMLDAGFTSLLNAKHRLENDVKNLKATELRSALLALSQGTGTEIASQYFPHAHFLCVVLCPDGLDAITLPQAEISEAASLIIRTGEERFTGNHTLCYGLSTPNQQITFFFNTAYRLNEALNLTLNLNLLSEMAQGLLHTTLSIGVGSFQNDQEGIFLSYQDALSALEHRFLQGLGQVFYSDAHQETPAYYKYPYALSENLSCCLKNNAILETEAVIREVFQYIRKAVGITYFNAQVILVKIAADIMDTLIERNIRPADVFPDGGDISRQIARLKTLDEAEAWFLSLTAQAVACLNNNESDECCVAARVLAYLEENYWRDQDIKTIAMVLRISYERLRAIIYNKSGCTVIRYVNQLRIKKAKELLIHTDLTLLQIAEQVGYQNEQSLSRFFKKFEGIPPGKFRMNKQ